MCIHSYAHTIRRVKTYLCLVFDKVPRELQAQGCPDLCLQGYIGERLLTSGSMRWHMVMCDATYATQQYVAGTPIVLPNSYGSWLDQCESASYGPESLIIESG